MRRIGFRCCWRGQYLFLLLCSVSEPFGLTALEAAHHGNALIISRQSGVGEVLHSIFRYDFWDEDVLADQLIGIATSNALKTEMQQNIKHEYDKISWNDVADLCLKIYKQSQQGVTV